MPRRNARRTNTWTQIGVSICVLVLPPILAVAIFVPHSPRPEAEASQRASEPVEDSPSTPLPITEGSLWPPSRSPQLAVPDPTQFDNRFAAAFGGVEEVGSQPPLDEPSLALSLQPGSDHPAVSTPVARFHHRPFQDEESRKFSTRHSHRISKQRPSRLGDKSPQPTYRIRPAELRRPSKGADLGNLVRTATRDRTAVLR
jgi:hypothetical protein